MQIEEDRILHAKDYPVLIRSLLLSREDETGSAFHWHSYFEITCIEKGEGRYYVNGSVFEVGPGDVMIFNNTEPHGWQVKTPSMQLLVLTFEPGMLSSFEAGEMRELSALLTGGGSHFQNMIPARESGAVKITGAVQEIFREWEERDALYRVMIRALLLRILTLLARFYRQESADERLYKEKNKAMKRLQAAFDYIGEHYCEKLTLEETARTVFMSPNYFSRQFHKTTDMHFSEYVTMLRLKKASDLLSVSQMGISEIALECGFHNLSNFYRLYRKYMGSSPGADQVRPKA